VLELLGIVVLALPVATASALHEVGHLLGLDEDELYDRGLD